MSPSPTVPFSFPSPSTSPARYDGIQPVANANGAESFILNVPYRSQYDGSPYQNSNCGPAALAMVLEAYGIPATNEQIRAIANQLQGTTSYDAGVAIDYLQAIAQQAGLRTEGLTSSDGHYRKWSMADLIREVRSGYPVITLVHYATLPDHSGSLSTSDHYIVVIGVTSQGFVVNDPAFTGNGGYQRLLRPDQLIGAWRDASIPEQAVAFLPPVGKPNLALLSGVRSPTPAGPLVQQSIRSTPAAPAQRPAPLPAIATLAPSGERPSVDSAAAPAGAVAASPAVGLSQWRHSVPRANSEARLVASPMETEPLALATAPDRRPAGNVPLVALVVGLVAAGAFAILRLPGPDSR